MLRSARSLLPSTAKLAALRAVNGLQRAGVTSHRFRSQTTRANGSQAWRRAAVLPEIRRAEYSTKPPLQPNKIDKEQDKKRAQEKIEARPAAEVSTTSSVRPAFEPDDSGDSSGDAKQGVRDITAGVRADLKTVKETLDLRSVPREPYALGLAGTLPYLGTSISTLYLSWNLRADYPTSSAFKNTFMVDHETAQQWLAALEPIQLGYGAVIISFLGAIHWGMEYGEKSPSPNRTRFRYGVGVLAPALAWPTLLLPVQFALIGQFAAFTGLYFADARATAHGWAPAWYGTYRFVLTFVVGGAIFLSLVGRAKVHDRAAEHVKEVMMEDMLKQGSGEEKYGPKWKKLEEEERQRVKGEEEEEKRKEEKKNVKGKGKGTKGDGKEEGKAVQKDDEAEEDESEGEDENVDEEVEEEERDDDEDKDKGGSDDEEKGEGGDGGEDKETKDEEKPDKKEGKGEKAKKASKT